MEFTTGLYVSISHLLKLAIAVAVVGVCVVLLALAPILKLGISALTAEASALIPVCTSIVEGFQLVTEG